MGEFPNVEMPVGQFADDVILAGLTEGEKPFLVYAIVPTFFDDHRALVKPSRRNVVVAFDSEKHTGPHRYIIETNDGSLVAANYDIEPMNGRISRLVSHNEHPHIDLKIDPEGFMDVHVSINNHHYHDKPCLPPGRARGLGSYNWIDGRPMPYSVLELSGDRKPDYWGDGDERALMPFFSIAVNGETPSDIAKCIDAHIGDRASAFLVTMRYGGEWGFGIMKNPYYCQDDMVAAQRVAEETRLPAAA